MRYETIARTVGDWHTQTIAHGLEQPLLVRETVTAAMEKGLTQLCITDHYPLPPDFTDPTAEQDCAMQGDLYFGRYLQEVNDTRNLFAGRISVWYGAEFDWIPDRVERIAEETKARSYDYLIGSVHFLRDQSKKYWILDYTEDVFKEAMKSFGDMKKLAEAYYREVRAMASSGLFDGVGHLDLIKKYSPFGNPLFEEDASWYRREIAETLDMIANEGMTMEINTAGLQKKCRSVYPSTWILREANTRNIGITIGSDAHKPDEIGQGLNIAVASAKEAGYEFITIYRDRKKLLIPID